jgi:predicted Zn-dependent peptidase
LLVATSVRTDVTPAALTEIVAELHRMRDPALGAPLNAAELGRAKADLVFSLGAVLEHPSRVADTIGSQFVEGLPADYYTRYPALIHTISPEAVAESARTITPNRLVVVIVGDRKKIGPELQKRGFAPEAAPANLID